jgi:hypothetical protein
MVVLARTSNKLIRISGFHIDYLGHAHCFPKMWGDGGEKLRVLRRYRNGGSKLFEIVIAAKWLTNWRVQKVFHPFVVHAMRGYWDDSNASREKATQVVTAYMQAANQYCLDRTTPEENPRSA